MRILFLTHRVPYAPNRGDRSRAFHMLRALAERAEVHVVALAHDAEEQTQSPRVAEIAATVTTVRLQRRHQAVSGMRALATGRALTHALLDAPALMPAIEHLAARHAPDLVFAYCTGLAWLALQPPLDRVPLVLDMVDVDSAKWRSLAGAARLPRRYIYAREARLMARFERDITQRAQATLVVTEREREMLCEHAPDVQAHVVPNGVDVGTFHPNGAASDAPQVVFCGVMNYAPNEEAAAWMAEAVWPLVRRRRPDARLALVGAHPSRAVCRLASAETGVHVTGTVPDVRPYLWQSAVAVAPIHIGRGVQNKVLEAVAAGLPCVITPVVADGLPDEVRPACRVASDPPAFASAILDMLARPAGERRAMSAQADLAALTWPRRLAPLWPTIESAAAPSTGR